jgi:hypothetical protein
MFIVHSRVASKILECGGLTPLWLNPEIGLMSLILFLWNSESGATLQKRFQQPAPE